ncbi:MAG: HNH endonuclease [Chloroflexota bacterium]
MTLPRDDTNMSPNVRKRSDRGAVSEAWARLSRRFWSKVDRSGECWVWTGSRRAGYGKFRPGSRKDGGRATVPATHVAWELTNGPIPDGMFLLHHRDNPPCVRPEHLFIGTALDNHRDMAAKGRAMAGERCVKAKLTAAAVADIRARYADGERQRSLAEEYGVSQTAVSLIVNGRRWAA